MNPAGNSPQSPATGSDDDTTLLPPASAAGDEIETDDDDDDDAAFDDQRAPSKQSTRRAFHDAKRFRLQVREMEPKLAEMVARAEAAEAQIQVVRCEHAFERAAGDTFVDLDAAWKLIDRSLIVVAADGTVTGIEEAIADLIERQPFLLKPEEPATTSGLDRNPFTSARSGRTMGKRTKKPVAAYDKNVLAKKYPSLRNR